MNRFESSQNKLTAGLSTLLGLGNNLLGHKKIFFLVLLGFASMAHSQWMAALPGWNYEFPKDHGSHPDFKTEWWYFTGNVRTQEGLEFGYQLTFFAKASLILNP